MLPPSCVFEARREATLEKLLRIGRFGNLLGKSLLSICSIRGRDDLRVLTAAS